MKPRHFILYALWAMIVGTVIGITACSDTTYTSRLRELILEDMTFDSGKGTQYLTFRNEDLSSYECKSSEKWCTVAFDTEYCKLAVSVEANDT